ncbi:MAG TPA: amidohydrolase [Cyclobacteriaceae bacterium]|nr:amidohydrolase [Cyclobacteriaceae bacterium]
MKLFSATPLFYFFILTLVSCTHERSEQADLAFINGKIWTGKDSVSFEEAVAVKGNTILVVGSTKEVKRTIGKETKVIDLEGKLLTPGFNDAHIHFLSGSIGLTEVDLTDAYRNKEVVEHIKTFAKENPNKKWITGRGWQYTMFEGGLPSKELLDSVIKDRPVFIKAYDGHSALTNSVALRLAKITKTTKFTGFGEIVCDANGEPTGVLKENAMHLMADIIPTLTKNEKLEALRKGLALTASLGITSISNCSGTIDEFYLYKELLKSNELNVRVAAAFSIDDKTTPEQIKSYTFLKDSVGRNDRLTARNVKFMLDGVIESHTAGMLQPYSNLLASETYPTGTLAWPIEKYRSLVTEFDKLGFQVYTHAIGDRAVREALNAYELAQKTNQTNSRNRIEHIETISPDDIPRFAALGVLPSMEPIHAEPGTVSVWVDGVGKNRLPYSFAWSSILKAGGHLVFSSDWPACVSINPIRGLHTAVTRRTIEGQPKEGWIPEQKISITQALTAYTQGGAFSSFEENSKGKIAKNYLADFVVLSENLFTIDPIKTHETKVLMTVFNGKIIYDVSK